jgi:hypothetical protein
MDRQHLKAVELPDEIMAAIEAIEMDPRHAHLDLLMADDPSELDSAPPLPTSQDSPTPSPASPLARS